MAAEHRGLFRRGRQQLRNQRPRVLTASATRIKQDDREESRLMRMVRQGWQSDAWAYYDSIGEIRYGTNYLANCMARMKLYPAAYPTGGEDDNPVPLADIEGVPDNVMQACTEAQRDLGNGRLAIAGLLHSFSTNMTVAGECFLLGLSDPHGGPDEWTIRSVEEIIVQDDKYRLRQLPAETQSQGGLIELDPEMSVISRIWTPHPKFRRIANSPYRAILDDMESLQILRRMIRAGGRSRLAARGILFLPQELEIKTPHDDDDDPETADFLGELNEAMMEGLSDEGPLRRSCHHDPGPGGHGREDSPHRLRFPLR